MSPAFSLTHYVIWTGRKAKRELLRSLRSVKDPSAGKRLGALRITASSETYRCRGRPLIVALLALDVLGRAACLHGSVLPIGSLAIRIKLVHSKIHRADAVGSLAQQTTRWPFFL